MKAVTIKVKGTVQGVGFRPFVYRTAIKYQVKGEVWNNGQGVIIKALADEKNLNDFINELKSSPPPLAIIRHYDIQPAEPYDCAAFSITESQAGHTQEIDITPDIATCPHCLEELHNPSDPRYQYPFINCTDCGPRYTIIKSLPYDRPATTMHSFTMCPLCENEYNNPADRRFHAQPVACPACGPVLQLFDHQGKTVQTEDPLQLACKLLQDGKIIAIKGLGGFHLVCRADNTQTVATLRERKERDEKPFALMVKDMVMANELACLTEEERRLLTSFQKPIVLCKKRSDLNKNPPPSDLVSNLVAPQLATYGLMLPYTPLHQLLFELGQFKILIMTSANVSDEPMVYKNEQAFRDLSGIADYFLTHNRDIRTRVDDSIVRVIAREPVFLRRARGYVPEPLPSPVQVHGVVACGGVLKSTVTIGRGESCYISPYIGKMENLETYASLEETTQHLLSLLQVKPTLLACDLHPAGLSTRFAGQIASLSGAPIEYVQHHHAHAAACMAENGLTAEEAAICVTYDGTGYGNDGTIWGGEIFIASYKEFKRVAHLTPLPMPGGELAIKHPWRMAWGALYSELQEAVSHYFPRIPVAEQKAVSNLIQADINCPRTSSMGRLFDALAALLGLCVTRHYEGQPAIILEGIADTNEQQEYPFSLSRNEHHLLVLDGSALLITALHDFHQGYPAPQVAARFHNTIARATTEMVKEIVRETGLSQVCLSGGCFQNALLLEKTVAFLQKTKLKVYKHRLVSPNDEGISYGQAIIAGARRKVSQERSNICV